MAKYLRIRCVVKSDQISAHERIQSVGGAKPDGDHWNLSQSKAISSIEDGTSVFYIEDRGRRVEVIVGVDRSGNKYLKTVADREQPQKLLSLPGCP